MYDRIKRPPTGQDGVECPRLGDIGDNPKRQRIVCYITGEQLTEARSLGLFTYGANDLVSMLKKGASDLNANESIGSSQ